MVLGPSFILIVEQSQTSQNMDSNKDWLKTDTGWEKGETVCVLLCQFKHLTFLVPRAETYRRIGAWIWKWEEQEWVLFTLLYYSPVLGSLNENGLHRLIGNGRIWRRGLVGGGVALLKEVCYWAWFQKLEPGSASLSFLLQADLDVELSAPPPALCLPAWCCAYRHDDKGLNLWNCKPG